MKTPSHHPYIIGDPISVFAPSAWLARPRGDHIRNSPWPRVLPFERGRYPRPDVASPSHTIFKGRGGYGRMGRIKIFRSVDRYASQF